MEIVRVLALAGPLLELIERRKDARVLTTPHVFHFQGKVIRCWRKRWSRFGDPKRTSLKGW